MTQIPEGVVTFLFTDLQGSTRLFHRIGDEFLGVLDRHNQLIRNALTAHDGYEVKTEGDAFFASFSDPVAALAACVDAQLALALEPWPEGVEMKVRMGLHRGPAHVVENDYVGMSVVEAARLSAAGHGGQILCTTAIRDAVGDRLPVGAELRELGLHGLKDLPEPMLVLQVVHPDLDAAFPPLRSLTASRHNLPIPAFALVGRDEPRRRVERLLLDAARLVVITGEGGIGKSRFALEVAWTLLSWFPGGVWWVQLASSTNGSEVLDAIATAVGADLRASDRISAISEALGTKPTLVVLDNTEQLGDDVVVATDLLERIGILQLLVTSRDRLRLSTEFRVALDPLNPDASRRLLLERARAAGVVEALDPAALDQLDELLAGMPLAIELAAPRLDDVELCDLVKGLRRSLDLLGEGERDRAPRHRALRSTMNWSLDLASPEARTAYRALGAFAGGADVANVADVLGHPVEAAAAALDELVGVALARRASDRPTRVWQLEPLRQHAAELLALDPPAAEAAWATHATTFSELAAALAPDLLGPDQGEAAARIDLDDANVVLALQRGAPDQGLALATDAMRAWILRGRWGEARVRLSAAHDRAGPSADPARRAQALLGVGYLAHRQGDLDVATDVLAEAVAALAIDGSIVDPTLAANIANQQAEVDRLAGRLDDAAAGYVHALALASSAGDPRIEASILMSQAALACNRGDLETARASWTAAYEAFTEQGDTLGAIGCARSIARWVALPRQEGVEAARWAHLALDGARSIGAAQAEAQALEVLGLAILPGPEVEELERSSLLLAKAADLYSSLGDHEAAATARTNRGLALILRGQVERGREALLDLIADPDVPSGSLVVLSQHVVPWAADDAASAGLIAVAQDLASAIEGRLDQLS